jgi:hypothetical protein
VVRWARRPTQSIVVRWVCAAAACRGRWLQAAHTITMAARREDLAGLLAEMRPENGPATAEEEEDAWTRNAVGLKSP